jgi:Uma2 family endonuclease
MSVAAPEQPRTFALPRPASDGGRILVHHVPWLTYVSFTETLLDNPGLRITFDRGSLELMATPNLHEWIKTRLGRFLEIIAEELGIAIQPGGNTTFRDEELDRGFEPDECYWIASEARMRVPVAAWEPSRDPPPDLILEVEVTRSALNRMDVFAAYQVPEVWRYDGTTITIHRLTDAGAYEIAESSPTFPAIPLGELGRFLQPDQLTDYLASLRKFREWVRKLTATS